MKNLSLSYLDDLGNVNKLDRSFLGHLSGDIKIREVAHYNQNPRVYAQSINSG